MPGSVSLFSLAQPQNVQAVLQAGGSLLPNTTYYFKIVAGKYFESGTLAKPAWRKGENILKSCTKL